MGDVRFEKSYARIARSADLLDAVRDAANEELVGALAVAAPEKDPYVANVVATELHNRLRRATTVVSHIAEAVIVVGDEGTILDANPAAERLLERPRDAMVGRRAEDVVRLQDARGDVLPAARLPWEAASRSAEAVAPQRLLLSRKDAPALPVACSAAPVKLDGFFSGAVVSMRDESEHRRFVDELRFRRLLLDSIGDAVIATRAAGTIVYWNRAATELYGWTEGEAVGRTITEVTPAESSMEEAAEIMTRLSGGENWSGEFAVKRKDGSSFVALVTDTPVLDEEGRLVAIIGVSRAVPREREPR